LNELNGDSRTLQLLGEIGRPARPRPRMTRRVTFTRLKPQLHAGVCAAALLVASSAMAVDAKKPAPAPAPRTVSEVVVTAEQKVEPGAAVGDIKPDLQLQPQDVAAYGVSTITDLLDELAPEIGSNSGRGGEGPAILVNGRRISGFNEIRNLPTESILRVDILPEEAALKYGFSANQRVVNIVLKPSYGSELVELAGGAATAGGAASGQAEVGATRIAGERRFNVDLKYNPQASLTEADRDVIPLTTGPTLDLAGNPVDARRFRTLVADTQKVSLNAVLTKPIFADISATLNGTFEATKSDALRGLPGVTLFAPSAAGPIEIDRLATGFGALNQDAQSWTGHLGVSFNRDISQWRLALTGNYDHADNTNSNDVGVDASALQAALASGLITVTPAGPIPANLLTLRAQDTGHSKSDTGNVQFIASGPIYTIPAGQIRTSFRVGGTGSAFTSESERFGASQSASFSRTTANAQASLDVPLTSVKQKILPMLGDINVNAHVAVDQLSDFGTLTTFGYGVHWTPITGLSILASRLHDQAAPSQQQLGGALLLTPGARIFDFATGQTVDVTQVSGGNPALTGDDRYRTSLRVTYQPWADKQLTFRADYNKIHYKNPIAAFPTAATAQIEAAFPDRFVRDASGELTEVDFRPINFTSQDVSSLKWGFDYSRPIGPVVAPPPRNQALAQLRRALPPGAAGAGGRRPGGPNAGPGPGPGPEPGAPEAVAPSAGSDTPSAPPLGGPPLGAVVGGGFAGRGPGGGGPGGGRGPGGAGRGGPQDGRLRISLFHTIFFDNQFLVRPAGPVLDFLDGASLNGGGGQPRQEIQAQINIAERGYGAELNADWKSGTSVKGGLPGTLGASSGGLSFSGVTKVNARLFADLDRRPALLARAPWVKGARLSFSVSNIFDQKVSVHDALGFTPLNFQPAYIDPLGRTWRIALRKLFS
jgi:iron complex outermembrane receptor protein